MLTGIRNAVIIYNPLAGRGRRRRAHQLEQARRILRGAGIEAALQATSASGDATALARRGVAEGRDLVIVCGGDGTVNEAVNGLAGSQVPLAVLPAGTANVLAKELRIPWSIPQAAEMILRSTLRRVALGLAAGAQAQRYFLSLAGAGPDAAIVHEVSLAVKSRVGILAYWAEGFRQFCVYRFPVFRVKADGRELAATQVLVGRTKHYGGPFRITTAADLFEDAFELAVNTSRSRLRYLSYLPGAWLGRLRSKPTMHFFKARAARCEPLGEEPVYAQVDGEPIGALPVEFSIVPDALTLVVPKH